MPLSKKETLSEGTCHSCIQTGVDHSGQRKPRVLHLFNYFEVGGTERQAVELLKRLDRQRFEISVAALHKQGPLYQDVVSMFNAIEEFPLTSFYGSTALRQVLRLRRHIEDQGIDIVHTHEFYGGVMATMATLSSRTKVIVSQRNCFLSERRIHKWGQRVINNLADRIVVNAAAIRSKIVAIDGALAKKIVVIPNGLLLPNQYSGSPHEKAIDDHNGTAQRIERRRMHHLALCDELGISRKCIVVGIVANLRPVKNHSALLMAAAEIVRLESNVHFVLVGEGECRRYIESEVARLQLNNHVHLIGYREDTELIVAGFDLAVLTSLHEGMPNSVMEAMAAKLPVVATAVGGIPELIRDEDTGFLVKPNDVRALRDKILYLARNEDVREKIGGRAYRFIVNRFNFERTVMAVEGVYEELLGHA